MEEALLLARRAVRHAVQKDLGRVDEDEEETVVVGLRVRCASSISGILFFWGPVGCGVGSVCGQGKGDEVRSIVL